MSHFLHNELTEVYHVSLKTIHNWIDAAKRGRIGLELLEQNGRTYIANTPANASQLEYLSKRGKKYRNSLHQKILTPEPAFYTLFSPRQILDIISNLSIHREIPRQYNYFDQGADNWEKWSEHLEHDTSPNILKATIELMNSKLNVFESLLRGFRKVNVIDLGVGNARPVKELLQDLLKQGRLHRYIAIDISPTMLEIAKRNIKEWFGDTVKFEGHVRDITHQRFDDLLVKDRLVVESEEVANLVLLLGGTTSNFRSFNEALHTIKGSMDGNDVLVYTDKPDTEASRRYLNFNTYNSMGISPNHRFMLDLLHIDKSLYDVEMGYSEHSHMRYIRIRLKTAISIKFQVHGGERYVSIEKGDTILMLRIWHFTGLEIINQFDKMGLALLQSDMTQDREYMLTITAVDPKLSLS